MILLLIIISEILINKIADCSQKQLLGSPDDSDLGFLRSDNARKYVKQLPRVPKQPFAQKFPNVSPEAIDLAAKMLVFDPCKRITGMSFSISLHLKLCNLHFEFLISFPQTYLLLFMFAKLMKH